MPTPAVQPAPAATKPRIPSLRLHKATGQAVVTLGGRDHYLGRHGTALAQEKYLRLIAEWLSGVERGAPPEGIAVAELIEKHLDWAEGYYVKDGRQTKEVASIKAACRDLLRLYGSSPASQFDIQALEAVRGAMIARGWARSNVNRMVGRVVALFKFGVRSKLVPPAVHAELRTIHPLKRGRCGAKETDPVRPVDDAVVDAIRPHVSRQVWAMVEIQRLTGMRSEEVCSMRGVDLETTGAIWTYRPRTHKTEHHGHAREVPLGPRAQEVIRPFLRPCLEEHLFRPRDAEAERSRERRELRRTKLTPSQRRRQAASARRKRDRAPSDSYTPGAYRRAIARACEMAFPPPAELPSAEAAAWRRRHHWHPHQLRHAAASRIRREHGLEAARAILGHRSVTMTTHYAELDGALARRVMAATG